MATTPQGNNSTDINVSEQLTQNEKALSEFWTEEAMADAEPIELSLEEGSVKMLAEDEMPVGEEERGLPAHPDGALEASWDPQPPCPATGSNTERVPNRGIIPYSPVGKIFMTMQGKNYVGTAWTIGQSGVFTAGHCVFDKNAGGWASNVLFVPQYDDGSAPRGRWAATCLATLHGWTDSADHRYDLAAFRVNGDVRSKTGSLGWIANGRTNYDPITGIGYPAGSPFDGKYMYRSTGHYVGGTNPIQAYNNMTGGCSGGPWAIWQDGIPFATGVNSFRYSDPQYCYSPYFGQGFINLKNWAT